MSENEMNKSAGRPDDGATYQQQRFQSRCLAMQYLYMCDETGDWEINDERMGNFVALVCEESEKLNPFIFRKSRKYAAKLIEEACAHHEELDEIVKAAAVNWALHRMSTVDRSILRLGTCEMRFMDKVPPAVAINEAIEVARKYGDQESTKFVNGVLESIRKSKNAVILPESDADTEKSSDK